MGSAGVPGRCLHRTKHHESDAAQSSWWHSGDSHSLPNFQAQDCPPWVWDTPLTLGFEVPRKQLEGNLLSPQSGCHQKAGQETLLDLQPGPCLVPTHILSLHSAESTWLAPVGTQPPLTWGPSRLTPSVMALPPTGKPQSLPRIPPSRPCSPSPAPTGEGQLFCLLFHS